MTADFSSVHALVDRVGSILRERSVRRGVFRKRLRLPDEAADEILDALRTHGDEAGDRSPSPLAREVVWHLILQGYDRQFLSRASRRKRAAYRSLTARFAPEVRRPEDARPYAWKMAWRPPVDVRSAMSGDWIGQTLQWGFTDLGEVRDIGDGRGPARIGGQDEAVWCGDRGYVMQMDGAIWRVCADGGEARPFARPPRMAAGTARRPGETGWVYFCATRWSLETPATASLGGIYRFRTEEDAGGDAPPGTVEPVALRVPWRQGIEWESAAQPPSPASDSGVRRMADIAWMSRAELNDPTRSRPVCYCNDLAVTADGRYLFFTEPSPYTSMGMESKAEVVMLTENGRLWCVDLEEGRVGLAADGFSFLDGVVTEGDGRAVVVTELARFRILRFDFSRGTCTTLHRDLPGMPDGLSRDGRRRLWQALLHERSLLITAVHRWPWLKRLYRALPAIAPPKGTGVLVLSPDAATVLYGTMHDGTRIHHIATVVPAEEEVFLPVFQERNAGLHWVPVPPAVEADGRIPAAEVRA